MMDDVMNIYQIFVNKFVWFILCPKYPPRCPDCEQDIFPHWQRPLDDWEVVQQAQMFL